MTKTDDFLGVKDVKILPLNSGFDCVFLVKKLQFKTSKNGNEFLQVEVGDQDDSFTFNCFDGTQPFVFFKQTSAVFPQVVRVKGNTENFGDKFSPRIREVIAVTDELDKWLDKLIEKPVEAVSKLTEELWLYVNSIQNECLKNTVKQVFDDLGESFISSVAAVSMHHGYIHGLLEHTVHVTRAADVLQKIYPEINRDLVIAGSLLHDVGKVLEYRYESSEGIERTVIGRLQGHVVLGYRLVRGAGLRHKLDLQTLEMLEHIVLSHQGEPEWGAAVYPSTPEAVFVSLVDNLDAKIGMVQQALRKSVPQQVFSDFIPGLQTKLCTITKS